MTTFAGGCSVSVTLTPTGSGAGSFAASALVSMFVSPLPSGPVFTTYTDENGQLQPIYIEEWYRGRSVEQAGFSLKFARVFLIHGTFEPADCIDIGPQYGDADDVLPTFIVQNRKLSMYAKGGGASNVVKLEVDYEQPTPPQSSGGDSEATYGYEFTSETEHVDIALAQTHYGSGAVAGHLTNTAEELLINFDGQTVDGVEIDAPIMEFTEEHTFTEAQFSPAYRAMLYGSIKKTNAAVWREFEIESVLFDGASATKRGKRWYVSFRFRVRKGFTNQNFTIVNTRGVSEAVAVTKPGWRYLWVSMGKRPTDGQTKFQIAPAAIHVAQVYGTLNFSVLGIGTQPLN